MSKRMGYLFLAVMVSAVFYAFGCGGSGDSSTQTASSDALPIADRVSVVDPSASTVASISAGLKSSAVPLKANFKAVADLLPSDSDYNNDEVNVWVEERSSEALDIVNEILCMMKNTGYDLMINQGAYTAQINDTECNSSSDSVESAGASAQNQSSSSSATEYNYWTVVSSRVASDPPAPHMVDAWMHQSGNEFEPAMLIMTHTEITETVSDTNPYGIFMMSFKAFPEDNGVADTSVTPLFTGFLKSELDADGRVLLKFYNDGDFGNDFSFTEKVALFKDGAAGSGTIEKSGTDPFKGAESKTFNIAYNDDYFYRKTPDGSDSACLDRNVFETSAWRYGLYNNESSATPGSRVELAGGFPIKAGSGESATHGFADYYGIWFPDDVTLTTGDTVYKETFDDTGEVDEAPYTVFTAAGKLIKNTRQMKTLGELVNVPLSWNDCTEAGCNDYRVKFDGTNLVKDAIRSQATNWNYQAMTPEIVEFDNSMWDFSFYSESLGGNGSINIWDDNHERITPTSDTVVVFHYQEVMYPGDTGVPTSLICFNECPDPSVMNTEGADSPYFTETTFDANYMQSFEAIVSGNDGGAGVAPNALEPNTHYIPYVFDTATMLLKYGDDPIVQTSTIFGDYGLRANLLIDGDNANLDAVSAALACDWNPNTTCPWQAWSNLPVFYSWESGTDKWNQLTALKDASNAYVSFDPPKMVEYAHTDGGKYFLQYNGFDLWGIPGKCIDMDAGLEVECYDESGEMNIRWVPEFAILAGSSVTDVESGAGYYIKPLEVEQRFTPTDEATCTNAGLTPTTYTLPDASAWVDPAIGDEPATDGVPKVIDGALQVTLE